MQPYRLPSSAVELLRNAAEIARRDMRDETAASYLDRQADIAAASEACQQGHSHPSLDQLKATLAGRSHQECVQALIVAACMNATGGNA